MKLKELTNNFFDCDCERFDRKTFDYKEEENEKKKLEERINIRCLKNAVSRILSSGKKDDAFDVYFCFSEIYDLFGEGYTGNTQKLLNVLGDHEAKAGSIKDTFRDHYSHAVYVFSLGLAIYQVNSRFQKMFEERCVFSKSMSTYEEFLYRWGIIALFHDIGYPFEIAFNNIKEYTQDIFATTKIENNKLKTYPGAIEPLLTYAKINKFKSFSNAEKEQLDALTIDNIFKENAHTLLAYRVSQMVDIDYPFILNALDKLMPKAVKFMDHAYFSSIIMLKKLIVSAEGKLEASKLESYIDACACILLHSGFWRDKFATKKNQDKSIEILKKVGLKNPLMFLMILCDELHIFDRIGYGRKSKDEPVPLRCYLEQTTKGLEVAYAFTERALKYTGKNGEYKEGEYIEKKIYGTGGVKDKIAILDFEDFGAINFLPEIRKDYVPPVYHTSTLFYQSILDLGIEIHKNYREGDTYNKLMKAWDALSLEQKMWNILPAKSYAEKLDKFGYFYDDKELLLEKVEELSSEQIEVLARLEHDRWVNERREMGWAHADYVASIENVRDDMRSVFKRLHNCLVSYDELDENDKKKDRISVQNMIPNLNRQGFFVYNPAKREIEKKFCHIGITGHRDLSKANEIDLKKQLSTLLEKHASNKSQGLVVLTGCDKGFDSLAASVCMDLGLRIKVIIPYGCEDPLLKNDDNSVVARVLKKYKDDKIVLPQLTKSIAGIPDEELKFIDLAKFIAANSDHLIIGWDRKETEGKYGTFYTKQLAQKYGKGVEVVEVIR